MSSADEHLHCGHSHLELLMHEKMRGSILIALLVTLATFALEVVGSWMSGSLAMASDAIHVFFDFSAISLSYFAIRLSGHQDEEFKKYGYHKLEVWAALINGLLLLFSSIWILQEAIHRLFEPHQIVSGIMLGVAIVGAIGNFYLVWMLKPFSESNLNAKALFFHLLNDFLASLGVIFGALVIGFTHWYWVDVLVSLMIFAIIFRAAVKLVSSSINLLRKS